jgi:hypothetical protein
MKEMHSGTWGNIHVELCLDRVNKKFVTLLVSYFGCGERCMLCKLSRVVANVQETSSVPLCIRATTTRFHDSITVTTLYDKIYRSSFDPISSTLVRYELHNSSTPAGTNHQCSRHTARTHHETLGQL